MAFNFLFNRPLTVKSIRGYYSHKRVLSFRKPSRSTPLEVVMSSFATKLHFPKIQLLFPILAAALLFGAISAEARPPGPPPCESEAECQANCPPEAVGCACTESPRGDSICIPVCASDEDCPRLERGPNLVCDVDRGFCAPEHRRGERRDGDHGDCDHGRGESGRDNQ